MEKIKFFNKQKKVLMLLFFVLFLKNFSFAAFSLEYSMNNSQYQSQTQDTNSIFGNFSDVAILKVSGIIFRFCQQNAKELCTTSSPSPDSFLTALHS